MVLPGVQGGDVREEGRVDEPLERVCEMECLEQTQAIHTSIDEHLRDSLLRIKRTVYFHGINQLFLRIKELLQVHFNQRDNRVDELNHDNIEVILV